MDLNQIARSDGGPEMVVVPAARGAVTDPAALAVLAAFEDFADAEEEKNTPRNTKRGYVNDWNLWLAYLAWFREKTGQTVPELAVTRGTLVGFVVWLDDVKKAAPNSIDRRITGVTVTARSRGATVTAEATKAARKRLKPFKNDPERQKRGRGKAKAATPAHLAQMSTAAPDTLAGLRDRALPLLAFGIAGRSAEVAALNTEGITLETQGLRVEVPSVKARPGRTVVVAYGERDETCPVRAWLAWQGAAALTSGPAFRAVDRWGNLGTGRLSADACRDVITRAAERAGLDHRLTGHSARSGFITTSRKAKKRVEKIRKQSGHSPNSSSFWGYIEEAEQWEDAASDGIGL
ncbi:MULTISPECIES: tyrosine-type recombinase/integrase [unclassified Streptomyces]|uniref:tyrosine-type recombinase/integrase n=1 Tax=unclassified Streptomyces TaxID=2593676 RepID=UPI00381DF825